jgi:hypothetical protein
MPPENTELTQPEERWLTNEKARAYIGHVINKDHKPIAASTLASYVKQDIIHPKKRGIGRAKLYDRQELDKHLAVQGLSEKEGETIP